MTPNLVPKSPDSDAFSTPPTSPGFVSRPSALTQIQPQPPSSYSTASSTKRGGRPHNLLLDHKTASHALGADIVIQRSPDGQTSYPVLIPHVGSVPDIQEQLVERPKSSGLQVMDALKSPCFVHSQLERGASLQDWLRQGPPVATSANVGVSKTLGPDVSATYNGDEDDEFDYSRSLTRQLAETAVGVREMSKALGQARIHSNIQNILIITKARDNRLVKLTRELAIYLMSKKKHDGSGRLVVYVDAQLKYSKRFDPEGLKEEHPEFFRPLPKRRSSSSSMVSAISTDSHAEPREEGQLRYWTSDMCSKTPHLFDFVVTLGGDGTVLFTSWLFQRIVPPVLPFALGSLGFLTNFDFNDHKAVMDAALDSGIRVNLRMRFTCTVYRAVAQTHNTKKRKAVKKAQTGEILMKDLERGGWEALEGGFPSSSGTHGKDREIMCFTTRPVESFEVLNDLVVDRGPSPYVSLLELFGDEHHMTTVQADGLVVSTPTGSTAYSLSAGGSLVHPEIPAILISPICPHTLSFRPMLLPDTMELRICVPFNSRSTAWASFDGRGRVELKQGDHIKVTASKYPFPSVCADKQSTDWFHAISRTLKWNERERQKSFVVVEEGPGKAKKRSPSGSVKGEELKPHEEVEEDVIDDEEDDDEEEEEEEQEFDITDSSPEGAAAAAAKAEARRASLTQSSGDEEDSSTSRLEHQNHGHHVKFAPAHRESSSGDSDSSPPATRPTTNGKGVSDIEHDGGDGLRDNIHSPKSLVHQSGKSKIPKDRDVENMRTPRANQAAHPTLITGPNIAGNFLSPDTPQSAIHLRQGFPPPRSAGPQNHYHPNRPSHLHHSSGARSADYTRRAFACWGKDESESGTDSN